MRTEASLLSVDRLLRSCSSVVAAGCLMVGMVFMPTQVFACDAPELVELESEAFFSKPSERGLARQAAIRNGVVDALQRAAGADIARGAQTATTSSLSSVERETREHLVIRSGGRILGWEVIDEEVRAVEGMDGATIIVSLRIDVCPSMDEPAPLVLAIGEAIDLPAEVSSILRTRLAEAFSVSKALDVVRDVPRDSYHDLRVEIAHASDVREVDNTDNAAILSRFRNPEMLDESALRYQLVSVTVTLSAVRFVDRQTISQTVERRGRVPLGMPTDEAIGDLVLEAATLAAPPVFDELDAGALDYARR